MNFADAAATLAERGWLAVDLPDPSAAFAVRDRLLAWLRARLPELRSLEEYHLLAVGDEHHIGLLHDLSHSYWDHHLGRTIIETNLDLFRNLVGLDLHIQRYPYLRAVRPGKIRDAAPLHRDTYYGASPYEVSVVVPFTDMSENCALRVISGSHRAADSDYPYTQTVSSDVVIRSPKHTLGFPYAPRLLDPSLVDRAEAVPLRVGQALLFPLSLVHGGGIDTGSRTRFSTDIRVVNSWAPVPMSRGVHPDYFVPLCASVITSTARHYQEINPAVMAKGSA
jgi:Phytanoyl-CoA dioxygenase (PhyH)